MLQANKEKRGKFLQDWLNKLQKEKGMMRNEAVEYITKQMNDPIKLRIINALVGE